MITTPGSIWGALKDAAQVGVFTLVNAGAPTNGTSGTGVNVAGPGCLLLDVTNKKLYVNTNTLASPTWNLIASFNNFFISAEQTGTGGAQNIAHGLGVVPSKVIAFPTDLNVATIGAYTVTFGVHTTTNVVITVTTSKKFMVAAWG